MKKVQEVAPDVEADAWLPGAHFADAFRIAVGGRTLDARQAAQRMMGRSPRWVEWSIALRNALVAIGRLCLAVILPFHRLVVHAMLRQVAG